MSIPQGTRLTNNQKLTLIKESQQPGFKIEDATIMQMRLAIRPAQNFLGKKCVFPRRTLGQNPTAHQF